MSSGVKFKWTAIICHHHRQLSPIFAIRQSHKYIIYVSGSFKQVDLARELYICNYALGVKQLIYK